MRFTKQPSSLVIAAVLVVGLVYVYSQNRGPGAYNAANLTAFLVVGISLGGIYAISALGLTVPYSTTGIFNFAHGAVGAFLAFVYWELRVNRGWPAPLAFVAVIFAADTRSPGLPADFTKPEM